jgi:hypothetical protein
MHPQLWKYATPCDLWRPLEALCDPKCLPTLLQNPLSSRAIWCGHVESIVILRNWIRPHTTQDNPMRPWVTMQHLDVTLHDPVRPYCDHVGPSEAVSNMRLMLVCQYATLDDYDLV